jgi:hypothetical protein
MRNWTIKKGRDDYDSEIDTWIENWYLVDEEGFERGDSYPDEESAIYALANLD